MRSILVPELRLGNQVLQDLSGQVNLDPEDIFKTDKKLSPCTITLA